MVNATTDGRRVLALAGNGPVRLNVGCGRQILDNYINIDAARSSRAKRDPDIFCDLRQIPLPDKCADLVMAIHVFEHFYRWEADAVLIEWKRLLKPGGELVLELPDLLKCARNLLNGDQDNQGYWGLYGDPKHQDPYMCHRWGWTPETLTALLADHGFKKIQQDVPQWHVKHKLTRDMRVTAIK